jgi:hypothetical protein
VFFRGALRQSEHRHGLFTHVLYWRSGLNDRRSNGRRRRSLDRRCSGTRSTLLSSGKPATQFGILALECTEFEFDLIEEGINLVHFVPALTLGGRELLVTYVLWGQGHQNHTLSL